MTPNLTADRDAIARREEQLRIQALGAALSRRSLHEVETAVADIVRRFHRNSCYPDAMDFEVDAVVAAISAARPQPAPTYADGLEAAAKVAEAQSKEFLSPEYATNQPLGSFCERFACGQVAAAIRALIIDPHDRSGA